MKYRCYDHRVKRLIQESRDPNLFPELRIPRSTAKNWIKFGVPDVVSIPELDFSASHLILENERLKKEMAIGNSKYDLALASGVFVASLTKTLPILWPSMPPAFSLPVSEKLIQSYQKDRR